MDAIKLRELIPELLAQFEEDGYSEEMMRNARWVLRHFQKFCVWNGIAEVGPPEMEAFLRVQYDLEMSAKDVTPAHAPYGLPELAAAVCVAGLQIWKRNSLLSILAGTAVYMLLIRWMA